MNSIKYLLVDSANRVSGTGGNFIVRTPPIQHIHKVSLISASIPNCLYNITPQNFRIYWNRAGAKTALIDPGAYSVGALVAAISTAMETADPAQTYNVSYSETTMKITITCNAIFSLTCTNTTQALWDVLGFITTANTPLGLSLEADEVLRLDFPPYLIISISEFSPAEVATTYNTRGNFIVSMGTNSQYIEVYNHRNTYDNVSDYTARNGINALVVKLLQPDGSDVDLNGANWSMLLGFEYCPQYN